MIKKKIVITGGGTGGHIFPGLVIADYLIKNNWDVLWIGNHNHMEMDLVPKNKIKIKYISITSIRNKNIKYIISSLIKLFFNYFKARKIIKKYNPDILLGLGGYISVPGSISAWILGIPLLIYEQNAIAGLANKLLSKIANKSVQAYPNVLKNAILVNNPVRKNILSILPPEIRLSNRKGLIKVLVIGGSLGCSILNNIIPTVAKLLKSNIIVWHQVGKNNFYLVNDFYKKIKYKVYKITEFIYNIKYAYEWADLIICRSGAMTISEIISVGLASILIPFKHKDNQQYLNTLSLKYSCASKVIDQNKLNINLLVSIIKSLNRNILIKMAINAKKLYYSNSENKIINIINELILKF